MASNELNAIEDYFIGSTNITKNIVNEIVRECSEQHNFFIEENIVALAVNLFSFNPLYNLKLDTLSFDRSTLEEFIQMCIKRLLDQSSPAIITLKCQVYFMEHSIDKKRIIDYHKKLTHSNMYSLLREITESEIISNEERNLLFKKIIIDIIVNYSLGNTKNPKVIQETSYALKSIMSKNDLVNFITLKKNERYQTLVGLRQIVCGIRVFNKDAGYCNEGIVNLEQIVKNGYTTTKSQLTISSNEIINRINVLTTALTKLYSIVEDQQFYKITINIEKNPLLNNYNENDIFEQLKDILILYRQMERYIQKLLNLLNEFKVDSEHNLKKFRNQLNSIHEIVKYRTAIPTEKIFPKFIDLSKFWMELQDHVYILSEINQVNDYIMQQNDEIMAWDNLAYSIIDDSPIESDVDRINKIDGQKVINDYENFNITEYSGDMMIEYLGFCTFAIIEGNGLLIQSNYSLGICKYKNKNYAFSCVEGAKYFMVNPERSIYKITEISRDRPELIILLNNFNDVKQFRDDLRRAETKKTKSINSNTIDTQTELHPIQFNINRDYVWNAWDLKRKAIQFANLRKCDTKSSQTQLTYQCYDIDTQIWSDEIISKKGQETQTTHDGFTNIPKPQIYNRFVRGVAANKDHNSTGKITNVKQCNLICAIDEFPIIGCTNYIHSTLKNYNSSAN